MTTRRYKKGVRKKGSGVQWQKGNGQSRRSSTQQKNENWEPESEKTEQKSANEVGRQAW